MRAERIQGHSNSFWLDQEVAGSVSGSADCWVILEALSRYCFSQTFIFMLRKRPVPNNTIGTATPSFM